MEKSPPQLEKMSWISQDIPIGICADILDHMYHTGFKDGSSSTIALYVNSSTVCGFFLSWGGAPPQYPEHSVWGCVGFYTIHTFLNPSVESQFKSFLELIISFLVLHNTIIIHLFKSYLSSPREAACFAGSRECYYRGIWWSGNSLRASSEYGVTPKW